MTDSTGAQDVVRPVTLGGLLDDLHLPRSGLAVVLGISLHDLDETLPLSASTTPQRVSEFLDIIMAAAPWAGSVPQALAWFSNRPLPSLGNQTAADLVRLGRADAVKTNLDRIGYGGYA